MESVRGMLMFFWHAECLDAFGNRVDEPQVNNLRRDIMNRGHMSEKQAKHTKYCMASDSTPPVIPPGALGFSALASLVSESIQMVLSGWQNIQK